MNIITLVRIEDGRKFQGFLDWDALSRNMNFYYFDEDRNCWTSDKLGLFKPLPIENENTSKVIGG